MENRRIKIGVFGAGRGRSYMSLSRDPLNMDLVAVCEKKEDLMEWALKGRPDIARYTDFDEFIKHPDMEAVFLANYFHEHAPYAIKAIKAGKHVYSECAAIGTLKEGVELCEAVEASDKVYMFGENHPFTKFGLEMKKLYDADEIGEVMYAEGEYNHPTTGKPPTSWPLSDGPMHWRIWSASTYYCTHGMGPLMYVTGQYPTEVNARSILLGSDSDPVNKGTITTGFNRKGLKDSGGSVMMVQMSNGSVFRVFGTGIPGHSIYYRFHGTKGAMECTRGPGYFGPGGLRVWHEPLHLRRSDVEEKIYFPEWPAYADAVQNAGHAGGDFWAAYFFADSIRNGTKPVFDVYDGCAMSAVGICGWQSALNEGNTMKIPNFRDKEDREKYRSNNLSPFPNHPGAEWITNTLRRFTYEEQLENCKVVYDDNFAYFNSRYKK